MKLVIQKVLALYVGELRACQPEDIDVEVARAAEEISKALKTMRSIGEAPVEAATELEEMLPVRGMKEDMLWASVSALSDSHSIQGAQSLFVKRFRDCLASRREREGGALVP